MSADATALIVDDEPDIRALVAKTLERVGLDTHTAANLEEARNLLERYDFDVCLTDMRLPDGNGLELVQHVQRVRPNLPVAVITAHGNMEAAVEAMKSGAFDFVSKPVDVAMLRRLIAQAVRQSRRADDPPDEAGPPEPAFDPDGRTGPPRRPRRGRHDDALVDGRLLVGGSRPMSDLRTLMGKVARTNAPVWITGESGTGKELIARLIHRNSMRSKGPFVAVNCGAVPAELMESEFFGHRKGSFTGAHADHKGLFRSAEGGTLFLDEISELPAHMQVKLLRAIQERSVRAVGDSEERSVDVRILSASHVDLAGAVREGGFRQDLYYRLNVITIVSPSLRERVDDIPELIGFLVDKICRSAGRAADAPPVTISPEAMTALTRYRFPGNVRELENILERAITLCTDGTVTVDELEPHVSRPPGEDAGTATPDDAPDRTVTPSSAATSERERIVAALQSNRWNRRRAAEQLGITYRQLRYRIEQMGLDDDERAA